MKSKGILEESIKNITKSCNNFSPTSSNSDHLPDIKFGRNCLLNSYISNLYISYTPKSFTKYLRETLVFM